MFFLLDNITFVPIVILSTILLLVLWLYISYQKLKKKQITDLQFLYLELEAEKVLSKKLQKNPYIIEKKDKALHKKLLKIRTDILNLDFTFTEIFT